MPKNPHKSAQNKPPAIALEALQALIQSVNSSLDIDDILNAALDNVMDLFQCHSSHIRLIDNKTDELVFTTHRGLSSDDLAKVVRKVRRGEGISSLPIESGNVLIIENMETDPRYQARRGFAWRIGCRSLVSLPLRGREKLLGTLSIRYREPHAYTQDEIKLFTAIGHLIGTAIENARLHEAQVDMARRFSEVLDSADAIITVADMDTGEILFINHYGRKVGGDVVGKICWQVLQKDQTGPCSFCTNSRLVDARGNPAGVYCWEHQNTVNGRWYECRDRAIKWTDGRLVRMEIATDITARRRGEQLLALEHAVNRCLANAISVAEGITTSIRAICDTEGWESGRYFRVEEKAGVMRCTEAWGIADPAVTSYINASLGRAVPLDRGIKGQVWRTGAPQWGSVPNRHDHLTTKHLGVTTDSFTFAAIAEGKIIGIISCTTRKIREPDTRLLQTVRVIGSQIGQFVQSKQMEEALQESESMFRTLAEQSFVGISIIQDGMFKYVNPAYARIHGYRVEELLDNFPAINLICPEERQEWERNVTGHAAGTGGGTYYERRRIKKNGELIDSAAYGCSCIYGNKSAAASVLIDITERKRKEFDRLNLVERLHRLEKMEALGTLAGGVAHDLNNILGAQLGYSELLLDTIPEDSPLRNYVNNIVASGEKAAATIEDLLTLARRGVPVSTVLNINSLVSDYLKTPVHRKLASCHSGVIFKAELSAELLNVKGSPLHLEKMLMNLASNAAESIAGAGEVTIRTGNRYLDKPVHGYDAVKAGEYVVLSVSDTGGGISTEDLKKIFEPFYTKKKMGRSGTGLGLTVVWGTVKDHDGYIDVESAAGEGTTFSLFFPVAREELSKEKGRIPLEFYIGHGEIILVVDDVMEQREIATQILMRLGYRVHAVSGGEAAVEYLKTHAADLVVLDMIMDPGIDGLETYKRILELKPGQKAIIASGFSETERVQEMQRLGAGTYVQKPYIMEKIGLAVKATLEQATLDR